MTPVPLVSIYAENTLEQYKIESRLREHGVTMKPHTTLDRVGDGGVTLSYALTGRQGELACDAVVLVTDRLPNDALYQALRARNDLHSLRVIGDAEAPNIIERAVFAGHLAAREFGEQPAVETPFRVERTLKV